MEENFSMENFSEDDAVSFTSGMYKGKKIRETIRSFFREQLSKTLYESLNAKGLNVQASHNGQWDNHQYFDKGIDCETL